MIIVYGLFIYSIYEFLKFLFLATLGGSVLKGCQRTDTMSYIIYCEYIVEERF